ncbi:MAG TPA: hypothetical protein PKC43_06425 [Phycisphaerales bacterium]|nr:hypothetical protein [Phycisphaerales bacterium]HMP37068.1 hypothetical protein [Phycisphaerales bacterium]
MTRPLCRSIVALALLCAPTLARPGAASAQVAAEPASEAPLKLERAIAAVEPALVRVEVRLRLDRGESPTASVGRRWCVSCGRYHGERANDLISQERPLEVPGFLVAPDLVVARDPEVALRFVEGFVVAGPGGSAAATFDGLALDEAAIYLRLEAPMAGSEPLRFAPAADLAPGDSSGESLRAVAVRWGPDDGAWKATASPAAGRIELERSGDGASRRWRLWPADSVVVDGEGRVVGMHFLGRRPAGVALAADPREWPRLDLAEFEELRVQSTAAAEASLARTTLHFRSPRQERGGRFGLRSHRPIGTELETVSILLEDGRVVVLAELDHAATARLERVEVHRPGEGRSGGSFDARFVGSLRDLAALVAVRSDPDDASGASGASPRRGAALAADAPIDRRGEVLPSVIARVLGRRLVVDPEPLRLVGFERGWRNLAVPTGLADERSTFLFDSLRPQPTLLAVPMAPRTNVALRGRWSEETPTMIPAVLLASILADLDSAIDPSNAPLDETEEGRTAWIGVLLQPLDAELAAANAVAERSRDGEFGGIVSFVYPDSPADAAGVRPGEIVLAIHATGQPRPIEVEVDEDDLGFPGVFPWERLDELPEEYYDSIPAPWPSIEDALARSLRDLGFGTQFELEVIAEGNSRRVPMTVAAAPPHFGNAPRHEVESIGLVVRDLTLEVRNYLGMAPESPGVVVAQLEPGLRASVAGLRPFEVITHVDGEPVADAAAFGRAVEGRDDVRFTVRRANRDRVVRVGL